MSWVQLDSSELEKWLNDTSGNITDSDRQEIENILKQRKAQTTGENLRIPIKFNPVVDTSRPFLNDEQKKVMSAMPANDDTLRSYRDWYNVPDEILNQLVNAGDEDAKAEKARRDQNNFFAGKIAGFNKSVKHSMSGLAPALSGYAAHRLAGRDPMERSAGLERQAEMHEQESADYQKLAQQQAQIANRDYRAEAERNAAANAAIQNAQAVANMGNTSAGAAALNRNVQAADYNTMMQRQDTMRKEAMDARQRAYDAQQVAQQERTDAKGYDYATKNSAATNAMIQSLSQGPLGNTVNANVTKSEDKEDNNHNPSEAISRLFSEKYFNGLSDEELAALAQRLEDARKGKKAANPEDKEEQDANTK